MAIAQGGEQLPGRPIDALTQDKDLVLFELALDALVGGAESAVRSEQRKCPALACEDEFDDG